MTSYCIIEMYIMKIAALLLLFILGGCVKHNTPLIDSITVVYINPNDTKSEIDLSLILEDSIEIIPLESNDESYVSYIDKIEMMHGHIFVLDKKQNKLFSFDSKGKYVKCMGRQGNGPGEFVHIRDFTVVGDSIFIQDLYQEKCIVYDMNNNYICEFEDTPVYFEMLSLNNKFYLISNYWHLGSHNLFEYNLDNRKVVAAYLPFTEEVSKQKYSMVLGRQVSKYKDYALLNFTLLNDTIYKLDKEGIEPYFLIQFTERQMPENLQLANERHPMAEITKKKYLKGLKYIQNIENYFFGYYSDSGEIRYILSLVSR